MIQPKNKRTATSAYPGTNVPDPDYVPVARNSLRVVENRESTETYRSAAQEEKGLDRSV